MLNWQIDSSWCLFLDRDGVINERKMGGYIESVSEFKFLNQVPESIAQLSQKFNHVFVVTNQQGIGKGIMSERNLSEIHNYMCNAVHQKGGVIDACYFAPALKNELSLLRKPNIGMGIRARLQFKDVEFAKSIMVGDSDSDILFGIKLGMKTVRIKTIEPIGIKADLEVNSLSELVERLEL